MAAARDDGAGGGWPHSLLRRAFGACQEDPRGSVHRAWGVCLLFILFYFIVSIVEVVNLHSNGGATALVIAAAWAGLVHLLLGVLGTFVLKRFPTAFAVGFFLGALLVVLNQDLILFGTFHAYGYGTARRNHLFANLGLALAGVLATFSLLLYHFQGAVVVAPVDAKGFGRSSNGARSASPSDYHAHEGA